MPELLASDNLALTVVGSHRSLKKEEDTCAPSEDFLYGKVSEDSVPSDKTIVTWNAEPSPEGFYL